jgi:dTDP-4-dehydrorhamnose reductase
MVNPAQTLSRTLSMNASSRLLVLGAGGMLGHTVMRLFTISPGFEVWGTVRSNIALSRMSSELNDRLLKGVDVDSLDHLAGVFDHVRPHVVVNAVGLVKQHELADDPIAAIPINALLPHRLARLCGLIGARLVHISTDCVFAGTRGGYVENDTPDATDLYGRSKSLGEPDASHAITLRTSIIGPELASTRGLVSWFLAQQGRVQGYTRAVFSGLPTVELATVIRDYVIPNPGLRGVYHVASAPIAKHDLLQLMAAAYGKTIAIEPEGRLVIDRSLNSDRFAAATGYSPPAWPELVRRMRDFG